MKTAIVPLYPKEPQDTLVFVASENLNEIPFTTSDIIAEHAEVQHHTVTKLIQTYEDDFKEFGLVRFKIDKPEKGSKGGRPKIQYLLNEEQATLLITYLKNTQPVRAFKKKLTSQFYIMKAELQKRQIERETSKYVRRSLTDAIKEMGGSKWDYKHYTDLSYKLVTGKTAAQLRKERGAKPNANAIEYLTADEIRQITKLQEQFAVLILMGLSYHEIKEIATRKRLAA